GPLRSTWPGHSCESMRRPETSPLGPAACATTPRLGRCLRLIPSALDTAPRRPQQRFPSDARPCQNRRPARKILVHRSEDIVFLGSGDTTIAMTRRSEEHTSELQSLTNLVCRLLLEKKKKLSRRHRSTKQT